MHDRPAPALRLVNLATKHSVADLANFVMEDLKGTERTERPRQPVFAGVRFGTAADARGHLESLLVEKVGPSIRRLVTWRIDRFLVWFDQHATDQERLLTTRAQAFAGPDFDVEHHDALLEEVRREYAEARADLIAWLGETAPPIRDDGSGDR